LGERARSGIVHEVVGNGIPNAVSDTTFEIPLGIFIFDPPFLQLGKDKEKHRNESSDFCVNYSFLRSTVANASLAVHVFGCSSLVLFGSC
jgi:hypothetical protein